MTRPSLFAIIFTWIVWAAAMFTHWVFLFVITFSSSGAPRKKVLLEFDRQFALILAGMALGHVLLLFAVRWFCLTFLIRQVPEPPALRARSGGWAAAIISSTAFVLMQVLIAGLVFYGFGLWHEGYPGKFPLYFIAPAFLLLLAHMPCFVLTRRITRPPPPVIPQS